MLKRVFCMFLSMVMLLLTLFALVALPTQAETQKETDTGPPPAQKSTPSALTSNQNLVVADNATEIETINITSGKIYVDVGKTYRLVHDDFETASLNSSNTGVVVQTFNTIYTAAECTATLLVAYYLEGSTSFSYTSCQVVVMDIYGTLDLSLGNAFVEKGKSYFVTYGEFPLVNLNVTNHTQDSDAVTYTSTNIITAVETGTIYVWGNYFNADNQYTLGGCWVDVFEEVDIENGTFGVGLCKTNGDITTLFMAYQQATAVFYPVLQRRGLYRNMYQNFWVSRTSDGYYQFLIQNFMSYLGTQVEDGTDDLQAVFCSYLSVNLYNTKWKILKDHNSKFLIIPKGSEIDNLVLSFEGTSPNSGDKVALVNYYEASKEKSWILYSTTVRINHYYDLSLQDNSTWDSTIIDAIPTAINLTNFLYNYQFDNIDFEIGISPTPIFGSPADSNDCPSGINESCNCDGIHHKSVQTVLSYVNGSNIPRKDGEVSVLWSDRAMFTYCDHSPGYHAKYLYSMANVVPFYPSCVLFLDIAEGYINIDADEIKYTMGFALAHEINHTLNIGEQSILQEHDDYNSVGYTCVMENVSRGEVQTFYNGIINGELDPFCSLCAEKMDYIIYNAIIVGNQ